MNGEINTTINTLPPFKYFVNSIGELPTSYLESMSYYETLLWLCNYLKETIIPTVNNTGNAVTELQNLYIELQDYVNTYFDNLDVQEEINNKLDALVKDGTLTLLIKNYVDPYIDEMNDYLHTQIDSQNNKISKIESGSPLVASSVSGMTDTSRVYVNTSNGNWYYYNGTSWVIGGIYQASEDSDSVELLNNLGDYLFERIYSEDITGTESSGTQKRVFLPANIKLNDVFRIELTINSFHSNAETNAFELKTTLTPASDKTQDTLYTFTKSNVPSSKQVIYFKPNNIASWFYLWFYVNGEYDFNITIKKLVSNIREVTDNNTNVNNNIIKKGYTNTTNFKVISSVNAESGIKRIYEPYTFFTNKNYLINIKFNKYSATDSATYYSLRTTSSQSSSNVIDTIDEYTSDSPNKNISTFNGENLLYEFNPSNNANYLYLYLRTPNGYPEYDIDISIYEKSEASINYIKDVGINTLRSYTDNDYITNEFYEGELINVSNDYNKNHCYSHYSLAVGKGLQTYNGLAQQGLAIYGDYAFFTYHSGYIRIYNLATEEIIGEYPMPEGVQHNRNHAGNANFGSKFYDENDDFPLLYVSSYQENKCYVLRVTLRDCSLAQTIYVTTGDVNTNNNPVIDTDTLHFYVDNDNRIITHGRNYGLMVFNLPDISQEIAYLDKRFPILRISNPLPLFTFAGVSARNGNLYILAYSGGKYSHLFVYNYEQCRIASKLILPGDIQNREFEGIGFWDDNIIIGYNGWDQLIGLKFNQ